MPTKQRMTKKRIKCRRAHRNNRRRIKKSRRKTKIKQKNNRKNRRKSNRTVHQGGATPTPTEKELGNDIPSVKSKGIADDAPPWPGSSSCREHCFEVCNIM